MMDYESTDNPESAFPIGATTPGYDSEFHAWAPTWGSEALFDQYDLADSSAANDACYENIYPFIA